MNESGQQENYSELVWDYDTPPQYADQNTLKQLGEALQQNRSLSPKKKKIILRKVNTEQNEMNIKAYGQPIKSLFKTERTSSSHVSREKQQSISIQLERKSNQSATINDQLHSDSKTSLNKGIISSIRLMQAKIQDKQQELEERKILLNEYIHKINSNEQLFFEEIALKTKDEEIKQNIIRQNDQQIQCLGQKSEMAIKLQVKRKNVSLTEPSMDRKRTQNQDEKQTPKKWNGNISLWRLVNDKDKDKSQCQLDKESQGTSRSEVKRNEQDQFEKIRRNFTKQLQNQPLKFTQTYQRIMAIYQQKQNKVNTLNMPLQPKNTFKQSITNQDHLLIDSASKEIKVQYRSNSAIPQKRQSLHQKQQLHSSNIKSNEIQNNCDTDRADQLSVEDKAWANSNCQMREKTEFNKLSPKSHSKIDCTTQSHGQQQNKYSRSKSLQNQQLSFRPSKSCSGFSNLGNFYEIPLQDLGVDRLTKRDHFSAKKSSINPPKQHHSISQYMLKTDRQRDIASIASLIQKIEAINRKGFNSSMKQSNGLMNQVSSKCMQTASSIRPKSTSRLYTQLLSTQLKTTCSEPYDALTEFQYI